MSGPLASYTGLAALRRALDTRDVSATELARASLAAAQARDDLNAFVHIDEDLTLAQARHADAMIEAGTAGPLTGIPIAHKDVFVTQGWRSTAGSRMLRDYVSPYDATVVVRLQAVGAVSLGKLNCDEFAMGSGNEHSVHGPARNPWDLSAVPGGSSGGSAAAVAARLVMASMGTDTGGSIRVPASFSGLVGLKTTAGLLPTSGVLPLSNRFDTVGPMARTVADTARLFAALLAGDAPRIVGGTAFAADPLAKLAQGIKGMRIGVLQAPEVTLHPDTARVYAETQALLTKLGAVLTPATMPRPMTEYLAALGGLISIEAYHFYETLVNAEPCRLGAPVAGRMRAARNIPAPWLLDEMARQRAQIAATAEIFSGIDTLLTPATPFPAPPLAEADEATSPATFTRFVNYLDLAGIALPMGLSAENTPVGMQIVVPGFHEVRALQVAAAMEAARTVQVSVEFT